VHCNLGRIHLRSDEAKDTRWMSWFDHGVKWDAQWHFEYAATMYLAWSSGENIFKGSDDQSEKGSAESEVYSLKNLRWQVRRTKKTSCSIHQFLKSGVINIEHINHSMIPVLCNCVEGKKHYSCLFI
jgi:hypothetical protein